MNCLEHAFVLVPGDTTISRVQIVTDVSWQVQPSASLDIIFVKVRVQPILLIRTIGSPSMLHVMSNSTKNPYPSLANIKRGAVLRVLVDDRLS